MAGLVLFLHGLRGDRHSWGAVPDVIGNSSLGSAFDVDIVEYEATVLGSAEISRSARQVQTYIETRYPEHEPIYLIGHSLGGLVARELCRRLLVSDQNKLLEKISAAQDLAGALSGCGAPVLDLRRALVTMAPRHRHIFNENSADFVNPNLHYETFESWVLRGHELLMPEIERRHARQKARREASEAAIAQTLRGDTGTDALRFQWFAGLAREVIGAGEGSVPAALPIAPAALPRVVNHDALEDFFHVRVTT